MSNRHYDATYEPRPQERAGEEEQRYRRFLSRLEGAGIPRDATGRTAAVVLGALDRRLTESEARELKQELPWALRDLLRPYERQPGAPPERFGRAEFGALVARELGVEELEAERVARVVFAEARGLLSEKEASDVLEQLPKDMKDLWAAPHERRAGGGAMPQKSRRQRVRKAMREGTTVAVKRGDLGATGRSSHAAKKSGRVVARATTAARSVSAQRPPGEGRFRKPAGEPARPARRDRSGYSRSR